MRPSMTAAAQAAEAEEWERWDMEQEAESQREVEARGMEFAVEEGERNKEN